MDIKDGQKQSSAARHRLLPPWVAMGAVRSAIDKAVESERRADGYHRHQRAIVLRPHDRKGSPTCQAGSLDATRESGRSPESDNPLCVNIPPVMTRWRSSLRILSKLGKGAGERS
jgi:hypothetical protein